MTRYRPYFNKDKTAKWLNQMSEEGWILTGFGAGFFNFESGMPGKYVYQVDYAPIGKGIPEDYRELMADLGIDIVCRWGPWIVLRKDANSGPFELYTDPESRSEHLGKILQFFEILSLLEAICTCMLIWCASMLSDWWPLIFVAIGFAALTAMVVRCAQISDEIQTLAGEQGDAPSPARPIVAIVLGAVAIVAGLLLGGGEFADLAHFLLGIGVGMLLGVGIYVTVHLVQRKHKNT